MSDELRDLIARLDVELTKHAGRTDFIASLEASLAELARLIREHGEEGRRVRPQLDGGER